MANAIKGEVTLHHGGAAYTMRLDFNALADFEDVLNAALKAGEEKVRALEVLQTADRMSVREIRALFWAGLKQCHPELTLDDAGRILTDNFDKLGEALQATFPDATPGKAKAG